MTFEPALGIDFKDVQDILMLIVCLGLFLSIMIPLLEHCYVSMVFSLFMNVKRIDGCFDVVNRPHDIKGDFYNFLDQFIFLNCCRRAALFEEVLLVYCVQTTS